MQEDNRLANDYLNLLKMTAIMRSTRTVMMAMVITRFVAILEHVGKRLGTTPLGIRKRHTYERSL
jgi:hypothetical protein